MEGEKPAHGPKVVSIIKGISGIANAITLQPKVIRTVQVRTATGETVTLPERFSPNSGVRYMATKPTSSRSLLLNSASPVIRTPTGNTFLKLPPGNTMRILAPKGAINSSNVVIVKDGYPVTVRKSFRPAPGHAPPQGTTSAQPAQRIATPPTQTHKMVSAPQQLHQRMVPNPQHQSQKTASTSQQQSHKSLPLKYSFGSKQQSSRLGGWQLQAQKTGSTPLPLHQRFTQLAHDGQREGVGKDDPPSKVSQFQPLARARVIKTRLPQLQAQLIEKADWRSNSTRTYRGLNNVESQESKQKEVREVVDLEVDDEKGEEEDEEGVSGVEDYLFGPTKKVHKEPTSASAPPKPQAAPSTDVKSPSTPRQMPEATIQPINFMTKKVLEVDTVKGKECDTILLDDSEEQSEAADQHPHKQLEEVIQLEDDNDEEKEVEEINLEKEVEEIVVEKEEALVMSDEDQEAIKLVVWENHVGTLPGLDGISFRINKAGLLEIADKEPEEDLEPRRVRAPDELLTCQQCGTYGMASEFVDSRYCGRVCQEERVARKTMARQQRKSRSERKFKLRMQLKKMLAQRASMDVNELTAARDVLDIEIFRLKMQLELIKLELTDENMLYKHFPSLGEYLAKVEGQAAPPHLFKDPWPPSKNPFKIGWKLEAIDPRHPSLVCVVTVVDTRGYRLRLRFDGYGANHDVWVNANSCEIFHPGWCERTGHKLTPPRGWEGSFNWTIYLEQLNATAASRNAFTNPQERTLLPTGFRAGMKLEAVDKKNSRMVCVASIADVIYNRILVHIDGSPDKYDYWADNNSPYIHPAGWCADNGHQLQAPHNESNFRWDQYSLETKSFMAPARAFKIRAPHDFKKGMKVEAVDKRNPHLMRIATIIDTEPHQIRIKFDGWPMHYAYWIDDDSPDVHPFGWCGKTGHPLEFTPTPESMSRFSKCPIPGCTGLGHAFRVSIEHTSPLACPYSPTNYQCDDLVAERFASTAEYLTVKEFSHSKGTKPRSLLSRRRVRLMDAKKPSQKRKADVVSGPSVSKVAKQTNGSEEVNEDDEPAESVRQAKLRRELTQKVTGLTTNPRAWTNEEVGQLIDDLLGVGKGQMFMDQQIDGEALLMLAKSDLTDLMAFKFGPAITLYNCIQLLRKQALECGSHTGF